MARLIPKRVTYVVLARNLTNLLEGLRAAIDPWRVVDRQLTAEQADREMRRDMGFSLLDLNDLDQAGFDLDRGVAFFSTGFSPTLIARIRDGKQLDAFVKERTSKTTTFVRSFRGRTVTSWDLSRRIRGSFVRLDDEHFVVHLGFQPRRADPTSRPARRKDDAAWLAEVLEAAASDDASLAASAQLRWVLAGSGGHRDVVGFLDPVALDVAAARILRAGVAGSCEGVDRGLARLVGKVGGGLSLGKRRVGARMVVSLGPVAADLAKAIKEPVPLSPALWKAAAGRFRVNILPSFFAGHKTGARAGGDRVGWSPLVEPIDAGRRGADGCSGLAAEVIRDAKRLAGLLLRQDWVRTLVARAGGVLLSADERGKSTLHIRGALVAGAPTKEAAKAFRDQLTIRPTTSGKPLRVAGRTIEMVIPQRTIAEAVQVSFADGLFRLTAGDEVMERLLNDEPRAGTGAAAERVIAELSLRPGRIADLRAPLKLLERPATRPTSPFLRMLRQQRGYDDLDKLAHLASSYKLVEAKVSLRVKSTTVVASASYELR